MYVPKGIPSVTASPGFAPSSSTSFASKTARPMPLFPPLQPTHCENDKDEDLYGDPFYLVNSKQLLCCTVVAVIFCVLV